MKKLALFLLGAALIVAGSMFLQSCESETDRIGIEEFAASLKPICVSEIPEGIVPIEFRNMREAKEFFEKLDREREKNPLAVQVRHIGEQEQFRLSNISRLRSGVEQQGGSQNLNPSGWVLQSLATYITFPYVGGHVSINSSMVGFTLGLGWEQKDYTFSWSGNCVNFTIYGEEVYYFIISSSFFEVGRRSISVSSTFCL